jgi:hypothetical protein
VLHPIASLHVSIGRGRGGSQLTDHDSTTVF